MPLVNAAKHVMLNELASVAVFVSLHDGDPSTSGTNELTGGSPAYARKAITWNAAASGAIDDSSNGIVFDIPAGSDVTHCGFWSAVSGGTFYGSDDVTTESFTGQGQYTLTDADIAL
jgi:hypothetical protein